MGQITIWAITYSCARIAITSILVIHSYQDLLCNIGLPMGKRGTRKLVAAAAAAVAVVAVAVD